MPAELTCRRLASGPSKRAACYRGPHDLGVGLWRLKPGGLLNGALGAGLGSACPGQISPGLRGLISYGVIIAENQGVALTWSIDQVAGYLQAS